MPSGPPRSPTRRDLLASGALVDLTPHPTRAGLPHPVAITPGALEALAEQQTPKPLLSEGMTALLVRTKP